MSPRNSAVLPPLVLKLERGAVKVGEEAAMPCPPAYLDPPTYANGEWSRREGGRRRGGGSTNLCQACLEQENPNSTKKFWVCLATWTTSGPPAVSCVAQTVNSNSFRNCRPSAFHP